MVEFTIALYILVMVVLPLGFVAYLVIKGLVAFGYFLFELIKFMLNPDEPTKNSKQDVRQDPYGLFVPDVEGNEHYVSFDTIHGSTDHEHESKAQLKPPADRAGSTKHVPNSVLMNKKNKKY